jgi:hypothetical protein
LVTAPLRADAHLGDPDGAAVCPVQLGERHPGAVRVAGQRREDFDHGCLFSGSEPVAGVARDRHGGGKWLDEALVEACGDGPMRARRWKRQRHVLGDDDLGSTPGRSGGLLRSRAAP